MLGFPLAKIMRLRHGLSSTQDRSATSVAVEIRGALVGLAVRHALGYRFVAMDHSVLDMTESIWPTLDDLNCAVAQRHRVFLRARGRAPRSGAPLAFDIGSVLMDDARLALNSFDW
jgi:hypothetical protein